MAAFDTQDLAIFLDGDMPGFRVSIVAGVSVGGLFRRPYAESFTLIGGDNPSFRGLSSDLESVLPGDDIEVDGHHYTVASTRPDGMGMIVLDLK